MGVAEMEEIVTTIKAMLKTLECPICLELLKTPVSAGCGHFFCKQCITGILQSTYRAPCPLCKRSFTRRSVQEAQQRQTVILAAKQLANTCTSLTEVKFFVQDVSAQENQMSSENISVISKKTKMTKVEKKETPSRKRKSYENEGTVNVISVVSENVPDLEMKECDKMDENAPNDEYSSPNKRPCSEDNDSDELPKIEDVFKLCAQTKKNTNVSAATNKIAEKSLFITATDKVSAIKTYSSAHKKAFKNNVAVSSSGDASNSDLSKSTSHATSSLDKNNKDILNDENETKIIEPNDNSVQAKNLLNALKNKTNEVQSDLCIVENNLRMKDKNLNENKLIKSDGSKSKENAVCKSPPNRNLKLRRKSQTKLQNAVRNTSSGKKTLNQVVASKICTTLPTKSPPEKDCYTLNQVTLLNAQNENKVCPKEQPDDPFKAIGITDTAVSVDSVTSPLATTKNNSVRKSPGWSRVKKEKKDFKMKKFTTLHVEKNSTNVSFKNASASDQETASTINKADQCIDENNKNRNEYELLDSKHADKLNVTGESVLVSQKRTHEADENILYNADESSMHCNKMDYSLNYETESNTDKPDANVENIVTPGVAAKLRTVSSTNNSSSSFSEKCPDSNSKISSQNALKKQKIMCELKNTLSLSTVANQNDISECVVQENGPHWKEDYLFNNTEIKQGAFNLPIDSPIYQHRGLAIIPSIKNIDVPSYVEQSQQTSQVFNLNFQNPVCDNVKTILPHQPFHSLCPNTERTKVVKRTAFTLEEIQDCFFKSNQTGCSETLCSVPFFSGLFKLHIGVSDDTLNVSVFKVTDPPPENVSSNTVCVLSDKASSNLFPPAEVVPSSDAGSESPQPDATRDPYPYLDKESLVDKTSQLASNLPNEIDFPVTELTLKDKFKTVCHNTASAIVASSIQDDFPVEVLESKHTTDGYIDEENLNMSEIIHFPPKLLGKDSFAVVPPKHFPQSENCKVSDSETKQLPMECNFSVNEKDSNIFADTLPQHKNDAQSNPETNHVSMDCDFSVRKGKSTCDLLQKASVSSNAEQVDLDFSDSDDEEPLRKLQEYACKQQDKKQSRLSLKKRSSFKRIKVQDSSEESDSEISMLGKDTSKVIERETASKSDNLFKLPSTTESVNSLKESSKTDLKKGVCNSPADMPSTLNSILSEDTPEANASEIILEIEDLSDKIKSLEERLKHCENGDGKNKNNSLNDSDSEDSTDLFPQSVPPTPPNHI